ncbi:T-lymphocyte activation antigen CD80-like isoform X4 [Syngnathus typhle]|uniref:T-lymphocyte activation antigen CD80-like isoform X4 n=1 Tax=Syngnathus typhle TaxID=161592 RepID=UPI002A6AD1F1|nr:T-lymphocyte activation antigen CD80-like isoform X4 [Syngnathus typhle]
MLWSTGLLLSFFFTCCNAWDVECVLGIVGRPLRLSCFYREALTLANVSVEWRRNENKVVGDEDDNDDALTGNFTLSLPTVDPQEDNASYSVIISARENRSLEACSLCVRVAAPFSAPELRWEAAEENVPSVFQCDSGGGFPKPVLDWLIDDGAQEIPEGSVQTQVELREDSRLYHITSYLSVNVTDNNVSCVVHNTLLNQTLTSTTRMWDVTAGGKGRCGVAWPRGDPGQRRPVGIQHGSVRCGGYHGGRGLGLPDPPGPGEQEEEDTTPEQKGQRLPQETSAIRGNGSGHVAFVGVQRLIVQL